jgi:hypothetical protein
MRRALWYLGLAAILGCTSTATDFTGKPKFPGGLEGCRAVCSRDGLELGAFVYSGEYSTSCVCRPRTGASPTAGTDAAPTAGVEVQTQAAAASAASANNAYQRQQQQQRSPTPGR